MITVCTTLGALAGAAVGALAFGVGAAPGAVVGAGLGFDGSLAFLDYLGLAFLAVYIGKSLIAAAKTADEAVLIAWHAVDRPVPRSLSVHHASRNLAYAVRLLLRGILQGLSLFCWPKAQPLPLTVSRS